MIARVLIVLAAVALLAQPVQAGRPGSDLDNGATLLLPYFEVDLDDVNGENTVFRIVNASPLPTIAHVTLWTDWAIASWGFEIYVEGNGAVDVDLRDVFDGRHPSPVPLVLFAAQTNGGSPPGECSSGLLPLNVVAHINRAHTGGQSSFFGNRCSANSFGDRTARGFATVDVLHACTDLLPDDAAYFGGGGQASTDGVLWGTFALVNRNAATSAGERLAPIQADGRLGGFTFFSNLADSGGDDFRIPLGSGWGAPFFSNERRGTDVILWRDPGKHTSPRPCDSPPTWFPLDSGKFELFNSAGKSFDVSAPAPFPLATNRVRVGSDELFSPYDSGWIRANLLGMTEVGAIPSGIVFLDLPQAYMVVLHHLGPGETAAQEGAELPVFIPF